MNACFWVGLLSIQLFLAACERAREVTLTRTYLLSKTDLDAYAERGDFQQANELKVQAPPWFGREVYFLWLDAKRLDSLLPLFVSKYDRLPRGSGHYFVSEITSEYASEFRSSIVKDTIHYTRNGTAVSFSFSHSSYGGDRRLSALRAPIPGGEFIRLYSTGYNEVDEGGKGDDLVVSEYEALYH
jgi:hypothetical protein